MVDISDTSAPTQVGSLALVGDPNDVFVSGDYAYVASSDDSEELQIVSISTPSSPSLAGSLNIPGNQDASGVYVVGSKAYITSW